MKKTAKGILFSAIVSVLLAVVVGTLGLIPIESVAAAILDAPGEPTTVVEIAGATEFEDIMENRTADSVILHLDEDNAVGSSGEVLGTLSEVSTEISSNGVLGIYYVSDSADADVFVAWMKENPDMFDLSVMSDNAELLLSVRKKITGIRGILDWSNRDITEELWPEVVSETHRARANVAVLSEKSATKSAVTYIQSRTKTVWTKIDGESTAFDIASAVSSGTYGLVVDDPSLVSLAAEFYERDIAALFRSPLNIAHRGLPYDTYENSLEGCIEAYENGATHIEIDAQLTKDGEIVIMHDDTLNRTTDYTGTAKISEMTLEEVRRCKITKKMDGGIAGEGVEIPTADEFFEYFKDKDIIYAFEIKTSDTNIVDIFKEKAEKYAVTDQIFVISFNQNILYAFRDRMPEMPTAYLGNSANYKSLADMNAATDYSDTSGAEALKHRGYMGFFWTYQNRAQLDAAVSGGGFGLTNNVALSMKDMPCGLELPEGEKYVLEKADALTSGNFGGYRLCTVSYGGKETTVSADVLACERKQDGFYVIFKYRCAGETGSIYTLYSTVYKVIDPDIYMSVEDINVLLNKAVAEYTREDVETLEKVQAAYDALDEDDRDRIDIERLSEIKEQLNDQTDSGSASEGSVSERTDGCGSVVETGMTAVLCGVLFLAALLRRRGSNKMRR